MEIPQLPDAIQSLDALLIYNQMLKWLCIVLFGLVSLLLVERERRIRKSETEKDKEIERLKMKNEYERHAKGQPGG